MNDRMQGIMSSASAKAMQRWSGYSLGLSVIVVRLTQANLSVLYQHPLSLFRGIPLAPCEALAVRTQSCAQPYLRTLISSALFALATKMG